MPDIEEKRLGVDLPKPLMHELHNYVPWGRKKYVYETLTRQLVEMCEETDKPQVLISMIIEGDISLEQILDYDPE